MSEKNTVKLDLNDVNITDPEEMIRYSMKHMPFIKLTGMNLVSISEEEVVGELVIEQKHMNMAGIVHGGMIYTLIDTFAGAHAALIMKSPVVTVNSHVEFLRPANKKKIICKSSVIKAGHNFTRTMGEVYDEDGELLCTSMNTYFPI